MPYLSLTTWSLHRNLGPLRWTFWSDEEKRQITKEEPQPQTINLLELPERMAAQGFQALEVCHFHFPSTEPEYLNQLRHSFTEAGITFYTLLLDYGDISSENEVRRNADLEFIKSWVDIAAEVGAERVRVVAGESSPHNLHALERSIQGLRELTAYGKEKGVRVITENFRSLASTVSNCMDLVKAFDGPNGLTVDFGNLSADNKYDSLEKLLPYAESIHAKPCYDEDGKIDADEFRRCLDLMAQASYNGPVTLVYAGPGDLWDGIDRTRKIVEEYL